MKIISNWSKLVQVLIAYLLIYLLINCLLGLTIDIVVFICRNWISPDIRLCWVRSCQFAMSPLSSMFMKKWTHGQLRLVFVETRCSYDGAKVCKVASCVLCGRLWDYCVQPQNLGMQQVRISGALIDLRVGGLTSHVLTRHHLPLR